MYKRQVIEHEFTGDTWLNSFDWNDWTVVSTDPHDERDNGGYQFCYYVLDRRPDRYALSVCTVGIIVGVDRIGDWLVVSAFDVV